MHQRLQGVQWLFLDPSVLLNQGDTDRETRRQIAAALGRRGRHVHLEQVERAWMQSISAPRPIHPVEGAVQALAGDPGTAAAILDEVLRNTRPVDTLFPGVQLALNALQKEFKVGIIGPYRTPGTRARLEKFHLTFALVALSDEQNLSHSLEPGGRPDPGLFTWALRKVGSPPGRAVYAGDRVDLGIAPAKAAGLGTIWVRTTNYKLRYPRSAAETPDLTLNSITDLVSG